MVLCVSHTQVAVPFLTTCQTVMPTVVVVHSHAVGNMTFTTCHSARVKSIHGEVPEEYSMSAVDMCMIENIPDLIDNGVDSLKIEGRMKSVHYVSTVANCYKAACDAYMESAEAFYAIKDDLVNELLKVAQRELATGFYYKTPKIKTSNSLVPVWKDSTIQICW